MTMHILTIDFGYITPHRTPKFTWSKVDEVQEHAALWQVLETHRIDIKSAEILRETTGSLAVHAAEFEFYIGSSRAQAALAYANWMVEVSKTIHPAEVTHDNR